MPRQPFLFGKMWSRFTPLPNYGFHAEVLSKRDDWFVKGDWPAFVAWWIPDDETPSRAQGTKRLEHLHDNGPTAQAFDFKAPFDAEGQPLRMGRGKIQAHAEIVRSHMRPEQHA